MVLGNLSHAYVEKSFVPDDRFDDLTTIAANGIRERIQLKHTEKHEVPLPLSTFTNDAIRLQIDRIFASIFADRRDQPNGIEYSSTTYRVVLRNSRPSDGRLTAVLVDPEVDPGPFVHGLKTQRFSFNPSELWSQIHQEPSNDNDTFNVFPTLAELARGVTIEEFRWVCDRLVIEVDSPSSSGDLFEPGNAERFFLDRVREEIGAGHFPNAHRTEIDVGAALIDSVRTARLGKIEISRAEMLHRAQLRTDYGAVANANPVDRSLEISRSPIASRNVRRAKEISDQGGGLLTMAGPPGHGKSWLCNQMLEAMRKQGWLVAEHYCYLGDADDEKSERVLADRVFGSLVSRLIEGDPRLSEGHSPRFAGGVEALESLLVQGHSLDPNRPISLLVDGVDHVTRVLGGGSSQYDPSISLAESLANIKLPSNVVLIVVAQPGPHLEPLNSAGAIELEIEGFNDKEIESLAANAGIVLRSDEAGPGNPTSPLLEDHRATQFLDALSKRAGGNALYATYLCREIKKRHGGIDDPVRAIETLPQYEGSLESYYKHLCDSLGQEGGWVADVMALVDFGLSCADLCLIQPSLSHRVTSSLEVLAPVLKFRATQGGYLTYHESFARYLRKAFEADLTAATSLARQISRWLESKGFFEDVRSYRSLIPLMSAAERHEDIVGIVGSDFVVQSIESGFPGTAINRNLSFAIQSAYTLGDWPQIVRCIELCRAAEAFQYGQFDSTIGEFADIPIALLGPEAVAARLVNQETTLLPARVGLHLCAILDANGAVAPWLQYMQAHVREAETDNTHYGFESDSAVWLAWFRGRLRLASGPQYQIAAESLRGPREEAEHAAIEDGHTGDYPELRDPLAPFTWGELNEQIESEMISVQDVVPLVLATKGMDGIRELSDFVDAKGAYCLAVALHLAESDEEIVDRGAVAWATQAIQHGVSPGVVHRFLELGIPISQLVDYSIDRGRERLISLTAKIQDRANLDDTDLVHEWLDSCAIAAHRDPRSLEAAAAVVTSAGWHKCWIRFALALVRAEAEGNDKQRSAESAFQHLLSESNPFVGDPRACDLFAIHGVIESTIRRGVASATGTELARIIRLLQRVSDSMTTTLMGAVSGPVPPRLVVQLASECNHRAGGGIAQEVLKQVIHEESSSRYYADIAEMHLRNARLLITSGDVNGARIAWRNACELLAGYGFRKDITIFELLDPLPALIEANCERSKRLLQLMKPLCLRVIKHTDGSETRWALDSWWSALGKADPLTCAQLAADRLLSDCNDANDLLHGAITELWRHWHPSADALHSAGLRLSIDSQIEKTDPQLLAAITEGLELNESRNSDLVTGVVARVDERRVAYPYSNGHEYLAKDDRLVEDLNAIASQSRLPIAMMINEYRSLDAEREPGSAFTVARRDQNPQKPDSEAIFYSPGPSGTGQAIRAWARRPYRPSGPDWNVVRFANAIGYRLLELAEGGRLQEAESALRLLFENTRFGGSDEILIQLAEGFERQDSNKLAALCRAVPWVHARRSGGARNIDQLRHAVELDANGVMKLLSSEISRIVLNASGTFETYGLTKALIHGFAEGLLKPPEGSSADVAYGCWNSAHDVISKRTPRIDESDDPAIEYDPAGMGLELHGVKEINGAFSLCIVASLTHPSREKKRRALLAIQALIEQKPDSAGVLLEFALPRLTCAATITWLLRMLEKSVDSRVDVIDSCRQALMQLQNSEYFAVRRIANRLLSLSEMPFPAPIAQIEHPAVGQSPALVDPSAPEDPDQYNAVNGLIDEVAKQRIEACGSLIPGMRNTVAVQVARALESNDAKRRRREFSRQFISPLSVIGANTFDVLHETVENQFQLVAGRTNWGHYGIHEEFSIHSSESHFYFENDPIRAIAFEAIRVARPAAESLPEVRLDLIEYDPQSGPNPHRTTPGTITGQRHRSPLVESLNISRAGTPNCGPRGDWKMLAVAERSTVIDRDLSLRRSRSVLTLRGLEIRVETDSTGLDSPPLSQSNIAHWFISSQQFPIESPRNGSRPVFGLDTRMHRSNDGWQSLVGRGFILTPTILFRIMLGLEPSTPFALRDECGDAVSLVHWRTAYETNNDELPWPRMVGCGVLVRPDLCQKLESLADGNLVLRDYVSFGN